MSFKNTMQYRLNSNTYLLTKKLCSYNIILNSDFRFEFLNRPTANGGYFIIYPYSGINGGKASVFLC